jgi:membrane fusion protein
VRAPQDGTVTTLSAAPARASRRKRRWRPWCPPERRCRHTCTRRRRPVGFVRAGQAVRLRFEAFPYQKYGHQPGHVVEVSRTPLAPAELAALALPVARNADGEREALFRIVVALDRAEASRCNSCPACG